MTTALDVIKGSLRRIGAYQSGEQLAQADAQDSLDTFNDLLESWSTDKFMIFGSVENILNWVPGQTLYKIGNPTNSILGYPNIVGTVSGSTITVGSGNVPAQLKSGTSTLNASTLTDSQGVFPAGTYVTGTTSSTITISSPITGTPNGSDTIIWTVPGDFGIPRPLRLTSSYTRINQLDFWFDIAASQDEYNALLYKPQPGPWPVIGWYNNQMPYGLLNVYQSPGQSGELHLFTDTILSDLTLSSVIVMPQGYVRALKWCLAKELWPEYWGNAPVPTSIEKPAAESLSMLKALNAQPAKRAKYDRELVTGNRPDGSWIMTGGMR